MEIKRNYDNRTEKLCGFFVRFSIKYQWEFWEEKAFLPFLQGKWYLYVCFSPFFADIKVNL